MQFGVLTRLILFYGIFTLSCPVHAATDGAKAQELSEDNKAALARDFVSRLKDKLKAGAGASMPSSRQAAFARIEEGQEVQFRPRLEQIRLDYDIYAIRGQDDFFLSLTDFIDSLNLPIALDVQNKKAQGWFLREDWRFDMDIAQGRVQARGQDFALSPQDYQLREGDIFVASDALAAWLDMRFDYDISQQYVDIESSYPLPLLAQMKRREGRKRERPRDNIAQLPRQEPAYDWASLTAADVSLRSQYKREGDDGRTDLLNRSDVLLAGDFLKHDAQLFVNADDRDGLNAVTTRLSRTSDRPELLGPLKARSYALGDVSTVAVPLTGGIHQELGVNISNNPLTGINFQRTRISGNALPGWDVELYRGDARIDLVTADDTGRYEFTDVQLFAGDNDFDVFFYGQQGEVRRERVNIPLNQAALTAQASTYDVSLSLNEKATYRRLPSQDEDAGTPRLAGQYNFALGDALAYVGAHTVEQEGTQKLYAGTGVTRVVGGYVLDANLAADEKGEMGARVGARKNIYDWNLALATEFATDQFSPDSSVLPQTFGVFGSAQKNFTPPFGLSGNLFLNGNYREYADGMTAQTASLGLGQGFEKISLSNTLSYDRTDPAGGAAMERLMDSFYVRAHLGGRVSVRAGVDYLVKPESHLDRYLVSVSYRPARNLTIDADVEHRPETRYSEAEVRANYTHDKFRLSPFVRYDSDRDLTTGVSVTTSLLKTPYDHVPFMTGNRLGGKGYVAAHVFLDVNGNRIFDEGDTPIENAIVESLNSRQRMTTREDGHALLAGLPVSLPTDIRVDQTSLPDPFMVSVNRGRSILPRIGEVYEMHFPVQFSGEVDGTVALENDAGKSDTLKFVSLKLLPLNALAEDSLTAKTAPDGFYLLSQVPPGQYFLTVDEQDARVLKAARPMPRLLTFTHEGTVIYAQDIVMKQGRRDIGFEVLPADFFADMTVSEPEYLISLNGGHKKSGLLESLYQLRMRDVKSRVVAGLSVAAEKDGVSYYRIGANSLSEAYRRCDIMAAHNLPCQVSVLSGGDFPVQKAENEKDSDRRAAL